MEIKEMSMQDIEHRTLEIEEEMKKEDVNVEELEKEVAQLELRKAEIEKEAEVRKAEVEKVMTEARTIHEFEKGENEMEIKELRNTKAYINAYADYIKTNDDRELRKVLSENGNQTESDTLYPIPEFVEQKVRTAWENDEIMSRVTRTFLKGNVKIGFEISATGAEIHAEGDTPITDENLVLGIVTLVPQSIKKMIHISDEVYDLSGEAFLNYIYDEIAYQIVKKASAIVIASIVQSPATSSETNPAVAELTENLTAGTIVNAEALLSDEATDVVSIMNRATWGALKNLQVTSGTNVGDIFDGKDVLFTSALPAYATAQSGNAYLIVGDLKGITANFPNGDEVKFKFDDLSEAEADLIKIVGRMFAGIAVTAPYRFTKVLKA